MKALFHNVKTVLISPRVLLDEFFFLRALNRWLPRHEKLFRLTTSKIIGIDEKSIVSIRAGAGTVNIMTASTFYKIGFNRNIITQEYAAHQSVHETYPQLTPFQLPLKYQKRLLFQTLSSDRILPVLEGERIPFAKNILGVLHEQGTIGNPSFLINSTEISAGLRLINVIYGGKFAALFLERLKNIFSKPCRIGPAHGDFHPGNLLKDESGRIFAIDWDCFRPRGIQALDALYFMLETISQKSKESWLETLLKAWHSFSIEKAPLCEFFDVDLQDLLFVYFVDRLGQEIKPFRIYRKCLIEQLNQVVPALVKPI